jgi:hypothetical protein
VLASQVHRRLHLHSQRGDSEAASATQTHAAPNSDSIIRGSDMASSIESEIQRLHRSDAARRGERAHERARREHDALNRSKHRRPSSEIDFATREQQGIDAVKAAMRTRGKQQAAPQTCVTESRGPRPPTVDNQSAADYAFREREAILAMNTALAQRNSDDKTRRGRGALEGRKPVKNLGGKSAIALSKLLRERN